MSIEALNWALSVRTGSPGAKSVLLILANRADQKGRCFPGIDGIAEQTELSRRAVISNIQLLEAAELLTITRRGGMGEGRQPNVYQLHLDQCAPVAHSTNVQIQHGADNAGQCADNAGQCAAAAPEPKDNPKKNPKSRARACRIPDDFTLTPERRAVAEAEQVPAERTFEGFRDYWLAAAGQKARKHDWDATWRNWCRREADRSPGTSPPHAAGGRRLTKFEQYFGSSNG